jgi:uncharacterized protein
VAVQERIDLARLALEFGQARRLDVEVEPSPVRLGGERYGAPAAPLPARLEVSRTSSGYALRLRFEAELAGPCVRCLEPADLRVAVDAREVDQSRARDEELRSPYVEGEEIELAHWAQDALALAVPHQPLCRPDCAGLCPVCGASLNDADPEEHRHGGGGDSRWEKLRELRFD